MPAVKKLHQRPFSSLIYLLCMVSGLTMPFLEFIPFSSSILAAAVAVMAIALVTRDGIVALVSLSLMLSVAVIPIVTL